MLMVEPENPTSSAAALGGRLSTLFCPEGYSYCFIAGVEKALDFMTGTSQTPDYTGM